MASSRIALLHFNSGQFILKPLLREMRRRSIITRPDHVMIMSQMS